ncbi:MAG TPA: esterase [Stellaceae bacterium]|nr:esterase [Stellaceae bacterium]
MIDRMNEMVKSRDFIVLVLLLGLLGCTNARPDIAIKEIGSFYIGGKEVSVSGQPVSEISTSPGMKPFKYDPNGQFEIGQTYVQFVKLAAATSKYPILMWHGGGLTGVTWETKPDGKPGWQQYFLSAGYDVYISDSVERGRATWSGLYNSSPIFRAKKEGWELFRIGPPESYNADMTKRVTYPGTQFPTEAFDQFAKEFTPRWLTNDAATLAGYQQLIDKVCPCIVIVHSQGGYFGYMAALNNPDKIKALIALEPSAAPNAATYDASKVKNVPILTLWGDNISGHPLWAGFTQPSSKLRDAVKNAGGTFDWVSLPDKGLHGNTHMMMMDRNSDDIAAIVKTWLGEHGL